MLYKPVYFQKFVFEKFQISKNDNCIQFFFSVDNKYFFNPIFELDLGNLQNKAEIDQCVFNLGLAEIPSFYKAFCSKEIVIKAGFLDNEQLDFWQNLYLQGLGEFFYRNQIDFRNLFKITADFKKQETQNIKTNSANSLDSFNKKVNEKSDKPKILVPLGGGKDSLTTAEILKQKNLDFTWFMLEPYSWVNSQIEISGQNKAIFTARSIQKNFADLIEVYKFQKEFEANKKLAAKNNLQETVLDDLKNGAKFFNGHIPISAVYAFSSVLVSKLHGFDYIAISQERSSSIGNTEFLGMQINHQYSKSFDFEKKCHDYIKKYVDSGVYYFSLLRNLHEIQIAQKFSSHKQYFNSFIGCNKGLKEGRWCGKCAKCAFTFSILSPFLEKDSLVQIWQKDLFEDENLLELFEELLGQKNLKPFDCVGTYEEVELALYLTKQNYLTKKLQLPLLLEKLNIKGGEKYLNLLQDKTSQHLIPKFLQNEN